MSKPSSFDSAAAPTAVLRAQALTRRFREGALDVTVLQGVDVTIHRGETLAIVGASGSGKSTLLHLLGGLDAPSSGRVELLGHDLHALGAAQQGLARLAQVRAGRKGQNNKGNGQPDEGKTVVGDFKEAFGYVGHEGPYAGDYFS